MLKKCIGALMLACCIHAPAFAQDTDNAASRSVNKCGFMLQRNLFSEFEGNIVFSPYSINSVLSMVWAGSDGNTQIQMNNILGAGVSSVDQVKSLADIDQKLARSRGIVLNTANGVWVRRETALLKSYLDAVKPMTGGTVGSLDFAQAPEQSRESINLWVEDQTKGKIKNLLPHNSIGAATRMVLVNAVYFKGDWETPFSPASTADGVFTKADGTHVTVPMMQKIDDYATAYGEFCDVLMLPYVGGDTAMVFVLPKTSLDDMVAVLDETYLFELLDTVKRRHIRVAVPRFKIERSYELSNTLASMGMPAPFTPGEADFSKMDGDTLRTTYLSRIYHNAVLEIDETGSEAAAATGGVMIMRAMPLAGEFVADRPFMASIIHIPTKTILFSCLVRDPSSAK